MDIVTGKVLPSIYDTNIVFRYWSIYSSMVKEGGKVIGGGYHCISQIKETFHYSMHKSPIISTYNISIPVY